MKYYLKYRCEFDTIKDRRVRVDIELGRNIDDVVAGEPIKELFVEFAPFSFPGGTDFKLVEFYSTKRDFFIGDILIVQSTDFNNGTYTITSIGETPTIVFEGVQIYFYQIYVDTNFTTETSDFAVLSFEPGGQNTLLNLIASTQSPLILEYPNGRFDKICPIRESKIRLKVLSTNISYEDFVISYFNQYKIKIYVAPKYDITQQNDIDDTHLMWVGWLDNDYITQPFLDIPSEIELSGNDGLSVLKNKKITDFQGAEVWGNTVSIERFITYSLYQTGLNLDYWSFINIYPTSGIIRDVSDPNTWRYDAFDQSRVNNRTFMKGPRDFDDCYDILSKIMQAYCCTLFQSGGKWYIINTNDRIFAKQYNFLGGTLRDSSGDAINAVDSEFFEFNIGLNRDHKLVNADALLSIEKSYDEVVCKYDFEKPTVYFRNFDLLDLESAPGTFRNFPKYWGSLFNPILNYYATEFGVTLTDEFIDVNVEIDPNTNQEIQRYLILKKTNESTFGSIRTSFIAVNKGDRISPTFRIRYNTPIFQNERFRFAIILQGNNNFVNYSGNGVFWREEYFECTLWYDGAEDRRFWKNFNPDGAFSQEIPIDGLLSIQFIGFDDGLPVNGEIHLADLNFNVQSPVSLGSASGYEHKSKNKNSQKNKFDVELFVSNSDNISDKGSLLGLTNVIVPYSLKEWTYSFGNAVLYGTIPLFSKLINRFYWNTMFRNFLRLEGRIYNIYINDSALISPLYNVFFDELDNKEFMITTLQIDIRQEVAEFTSIELVDQVNDFDANDEFRYVSKNNLIESFRYLDVKAKDYNNPIKEPKIPLDYKFGVPSIVLSLIRRNKIRRFNNYS